MENKLHIKFTSKPAIFTIMVIMAVFITACGSPSASVTQDNAVNQADATESSPTESAPVDATQEPVAVTADQAASLAEVSYSNDISPILEASCIKCHGVEKISRGLDLTSYDKAMKGSVKGPVILSGDPDNSPLVKLVVAGKMPKQGAKLTQPQIEILRNWINQGAPNN